MIRAISIGIVAVCVAASGQTKLEWQRMTAPAGFRFALSGATREKPAPVLFLLGGSMDDTVTNETFARIAVPWREAGGMVVAVDSPSHGAEQPTDEKNSLRAWRNRLVAGDNFVPTFTARLRGLLDHLIRERLADESRVGVAGISRGGFLAVHFAASEPRVRFIGAFTFVSDLSTLVEFNGAEQNPLVRSLGLIHLAGRVTDRSLFGIIGSTDYRAGTARAIELIVRVAETAVAMGKRPAAELKIVPVAGHQLELQDFSTGGGWLASRLQSISTTP
jgi:pimeloyl-ACP methyl ester carboxylesterase